MDVEWSKPALKELKRLDRKLRLRIVAAVARFAETSEGDVKVEKPRVRFKIPLRGPLLPCPYRWC